MKERHNITVVQMAARTRPKRAAGFMDESDTEEDRDSLRTERIKRGETVIRPYQEKDRPGDILMAQRTLRPQQDERFKSPSSSQSKLRLKPSSQSNEHVGTTSTARSTKGVNVNRLRELLGKKEQMPVINEQRRGDQPLLESEAPTMAARDALGTEAEHRRWHQSKNLAEVRSLLSSRQKPRHRQSPNVIGSKRPEHNQRSHHLHKDPMHRDNAEPPFKKAVLPTTISTRKNALPRAQKSEEAGIQVRQSALDNSESGAVAQGRQKGTHAGRTSSDKRTDAIEAVAASAMRQRSEFGDLLAKPSTHDIASFGHSSMQPKVKTEAISQQQSPTPEPHRSDKADSNMSKGTIERPVSQHRHATHGYISGGPQYILQQPNQQSKSIMGFSQNTSGLTNDTTWEHANINEQRPHPSASRQLKYVPSSPKLSCVTPKIMQTPVKRNVQQISGGAIHSGRPTKKQVQSLGPSNDPISTELKAQRPVDNFTTNLYDKIDMNVNSSQKSEGTSQTISFDHSEEGDEIGPSRTRHNASLYGGVIPHAKVSQKMESPSSQVQKTRLQGKAFAGLQQRGKGTGEDCSQNKITRNSPHVLGPAAPITPPNTPKQPIFALSAISSTSTKPRQPKVTYQDITVQNLTVMRLPPLPPFSGNTEPFFEFSIFQRTWQHDQKGSEIAAEELTARPFTCLEEANSRAEQHFANIRQQYEQNFAVQFIRQTMTLDLYGCYIIAGAFSQIGYLQKKIFVTIWVQRDHVSELANVAPQKLSLTSFISKTVYILRLFKIVPWVTAAPDPDSDSDSDTGSEQDDQYENEADDPDLTKESKNAENSKEGELIGVNALHVPHPISCAEIYTTLEAANAAAKALQIELSHEKEPKHYQQVFQQNDSLKLNNILTALNNTGRLWKTNFKTPGFDGSDFELAVEQTTLCGPRNL